VSGPVSLRERLGLDYLFESPTKPDGDAPSAQPYAAGLEIVASERFLDVVEKLSHSTGAPDGVKLSQVADETGFDAQVLVPLTNRLVDANLVMIVNPDTFGDHTVELTSEGDQLAKSSDPSELRRALET
jgi:hypothetical protein